MVKGANAEDMELVRGIGEEYKERIAKDSDLVKGILKAVTARNSPGDNSRGNTPVYTTNRNDSLSQQILSTFSPDSAYSSNSSHSPPENASSYAGNHPHSAQLTHHSNSMVFDSFVI